MMSKRLFRIAIVCLLFYKGETRSLFQVPFTKDFNDLMNSFHVKGNLPKFYEDIFNSILAASDKIQLHYQADKCPSKLLNILSNLIKCETAAKELFPYLHYIDLYQASLGNYKIFESVWIRKDCSELVGRSEKICSELLSMSNKGEPSISSTD